MNRTIRGLIIFFGVVSFCLIGFMVYFIIIGGSPFRAFTSSTKLVKTTNIPMEQLNAVEVTFYEDEVFLMESDTDEIIIREYSNQHPDKVELAKVSASDNKLTVRGAKSRIRFGLYNYSGYAEIYLPAAYHGELSVSTASGDINFEDNFDCASLSASSSSGNIAADTIKANAVKLSSSSGDIKINQAEGARDIHTDSGNIAVNGGAGSSRIESSSGEIKVKNYDGDMHVSSTSGGINLWEGIGNTIAESKSGSVSLKYLGSMGELNLSALSGDVTLDIPEDISLSFNAKTTSGDIHTYFDDFLSYNKKGNSVNGIVGVNPELDIHISTTSGEVSVR